MGPIALWSDHLPSLLPTPAVVERSDEGALELRNLNGPLTDRPCANVLGIAVEALNLESALSRVAQALQPNQKGYVCAVGVHGILEARRDAHVAQAFADASIVVPDGTPTVWVGWLQK